MPLALSDPYSYSHLLGLALAGMRPPPEDGHRPRFDVASKAPETVDDAAVSLALVSGTSGDEWAELFPQARPGRRPGEPAALAPWQQDIVAREPKAFLRGLLEADGCRVINRFTTTLPSGRVVEYAYPRYFFSNSSAEIRGLFCEACERVGVRWTQSNQRSISIAHRASVAVLDAFLGPPG